MKFGQLIEYDMRNTFLKKSYGKCTGETIPRSFSKKPKLSIFLGQEPKFLNCLFSQYTKFRAIEIYWNQAAEQLLLLYKVFLINKKRSGTGVPASFSAWFLK